jgi:ribosomal protein S18 acetylase RimI-like enzyme
VAPCELLEWDSEHFGFPIARVNGDSLDHETAEAIDDWCRDQGIRCLYFLAQADDAESARIAAERGYRVVDERLTIRHPLDQPPLVPKEVAGGWRIRDATEDDLETLCEIAARSHRNTRFYFDGGFPAERCDELYREWVRRGLRDEARQLRVPEREGELAGYQVIRPPAPGGEGVLDILALDDRHRGRGIGRLLLSDSLAWLDARGAPAVLTVLQARNVASVRLHERVGFLTERVEIWHHRWYQ